jgi:hypothetical protein
MHIDTKARQVAAPLHQAQRFAHDFARGLVQAAVNLLVHEMLELRSQRDVRRESVLSNRCLAL